MAALLATTSVGTVVLGNTGAVRAQAAEQPFSIPAGPLSQALVAFGRQSGLQITYLAAVASNRTSAGFSGSATSRDALTRILSGSGLSFSFTNATTVTIAEAGSQDTANVAAGADDGTLQLETVTVNGATRPDDRPFLTPGSSSYISREQIERYQGTSPADILKSAPGVLSGESRVNGGVDVNIRGLQGVGRVGVTVDGASNAMTVSRGYQGVANRSYIDPDFIGGVDIERGPSTGATGASNIGGTVAVRTVGVDDIIPEGKSSAVRVKVEGGTNTSGVSSRTRDAILLSPGTLYGGTNDEVDRPGSLEPTSGSASSVFAARSENVDFLAGVSHRRSGNYHAGKNGNDAPEKVDCDASVSANCARYDDWWRYGITSYLPGEEVLNTSQDTYSALMKATFRFDDQTLEVGYSRYDSVYGETYPFSFVLPGQRTYEQTPSHTRLDSYTARYDWDPESELIDFHANAWLTNMADSSQLSNTDRYQTKKWSRIWGGDVGNTARWNGAYGDLALTTGLAYTFEETAPYENKGIGSVSAFSRDGSRSETAASASTVWSPMPWLDLSGGLRWHGARIDDDYEDFESGSESYDFSGVDYSTGLTLKPTEGVQLFATYSDAARLPSLFERGRAFLITVNPDLEPERSSKWEVGANLKRDGVINDDDTLGLKLSYFDNTVKDYIYRKAVPFEYLPGRFLTNLSIDNLPKADFAGIEMQAMYERGGFSAQINGNYYTEVQFCRTSDTCIDGSLASDYATNYVPPEYSVSLTLSQKFLDDALTLSGRVSHVGPRAGEAETPSSGANPLIALIDWEPYTKLDLFASYDINESLELHASIENLTDVYYVDPLNLALLPSPGRTVKLGLTGTIGAGGEGSGADLKSAPEVDWQGFYAGLHSGWANANRRIEDYVQAYSEDPPAFLYEYPLGEAVGGVGGVQIGYDWTLTRNIVLGLQAEASWLDASSTASIDDASSENENDVFHARYKWMTTLKARAGVPLGRLLAYGTVGWTAAGVDADETYYGTAIKDSMTMTGLSVGGGVEYAFTDHLSAFGDYQFSNLKGNFDGSGTIESFDLPLDISWTARDRVDLMKFGVNYRF